MASRRKAARALAIYLGPLREFRLSRPDRYFDWQSLPREQVEPAATTDPRGRLRLLLLLFAILLAVVASRVVSLEISYGDAFAPRPTSPWNAGYASPPRADESWPPTEPCWLAMSRCWRWP